MDFLKKTWVKVLAWVLFFVSIVLLILTGTTAEEIDQAKMLGITAVLAVSAVVAFVTERTKK